MGTKETIQSSFLNQVRDKLPPTISFADELAEVLSVSRDSAYRRIRGETLLSLDEVKKLCDHFRISLDHALSPSSEIVAFQVRSLNSEHFSFEKWLQSIYDNLHMIGQFGEKELIFHAKDLPIFHFFQYPLLASFKIYFWLRTFARSDIDKFNPASISHDLLSLGKRIWDKYADTPSTEILSPEALTATLRNIEFTRECELFHDPEDAARLCDDCMLLLDNLSKQVELGRKGSSPDFQGGAPFDVYHNELLIGDNTILFKMGEKRVAFVTANNFDLLATSQEFFCRQTEQHINNLISRSTLISHNAQKERLKFFNKVRDRVAETRKAVS
jgi:hypothetical protein